MAFAADIIHSELLQEIDILKEIYIDELQYNDSCTSGQPRFVSIKLYPSTGDCSDQKWVCLTLHLQLPPDYPTDVPSVHIRSPRGLSEDFVNCLKKSLTELAAEKKGYPMLYDLIEHARESLTTGNVLQGQCMICLEELSGSRSVCTSTLCYHFFHWACIYSYIKHCHREFQEWQNECKNNNPLAEEKVFEAVCPVCRELLPEEVVSGVDTSDLWDSIDSDEEQVKYEPSSEVLELQRNMSELYQLQLQKGGIIDLEAERNKFLVPKEGLMVPISRLDDSVDLKNLDDANVSEHQGGDESHIEQMGKQVSSDGCSSKEEVSQLLHETTVSKDTEPESRRLSSSTRRFAGRNRFSLSGEKRRDRHWRDEYSLHNTDHRKQYKVPLDAEPVTELTADRPISDELNNDEAAADEPLMHAESRQHSGNNERSQSSTDTGDRSTAYDTGLTKPAMPSACKQKSSGRSSDNYRTDGRRHFSNAYSKYSDDYDDFVVQPNVRSGRKRNRHSKSTKTAADAASSDARNDFDEDVKDFDHSDAVCSSSAPAESDCSTVIAGIKQTQTQFSNVPRRRRNNEYRGHQNSRDRPNYSSTQDAITAPRPSNSTETGNSVELKARRQWPRKQWGRKDPEKARGPPVSSDEQLQKAAEALSQLSVDECCKDADDRPECDNVGVIHKSSDSSRQKCGTRANVYQSTTDSCSRGMGFHRRRNNRSVRGGTHSIKVESTVPHDQQCSPDRASGSSYAPKEEYQRRGGGSRRGSRRSHDLRKPTDKERSYDNQSDQVKKPSEVPSTSPASREFISNSRPPGFHVQHRPTSATVQLPTS